MSTKSKKKTDPIIIGWREWVGLPDFGVPSIKLKVDTGARTSSLHAFNVEEFYRGKKKFVRFELHPEQRTSKPVIKAEAPLIEYRSVRSSSGKAELRPVVMATVSIHGVDTLEELTLTDRDAMGFRMLLGRQALRGKFIVDPGRSFTNGRRIVSRKTLKIAKRKNS
ncbi:MAG: hypothetical protein ACI97A_001675 [Planctomycetota bacterium]|jgi:hypothetical protein